MYLGVDPGYQRRTLLRQLLFSASFSAIYLTTDHQHFKKMGIVKMTAIAVNQTSTTGSHIALRKKDAPGATTGGSAPRQVHKLVTTAWRQEHDAVGAFSSKPGGKVAQQPSVSGWWCADA
jgi:hypothetical protein